MPRLQRATSTSPSSAAAWSARRVALGPRARAASASRVLDEGDVAFRASRGNFALVWVQSKGLGMPEYAGWTHALVRRLGRLRRRPEGRRPASTSRFQRPGGFHLCALRGASSSARARSCSACTTSRASPTIPTEMLDRARVEAHAAGHRAGGGRRQLLPARRPLQFAAGCFRALHTGMQQLGVALPARASASSASQHAAASSALATPTGEVARRQGRARGRHRQRAARRRWSASTRRCGRSAARSSSPRSVAPFLRLPGRHDLRQTDEGGVMIGDRQEEAGVDPTRDHAGHRGAWPTRAVRMFPLLGEPQRRAHLGGAARHDPGRLPDLRAVRRRCPGAFVVTLPLRRDARAPPCARRSRRMIAAGALVGRRSFGAFQRAEVRCSRRLPERRRRARVTIYDRRQARSRRAPATPSRRRCWRPASSTAARRRCRARRARPTA